MKRYIPLELSAALELLRYLPPAVRRAVLHASSAEQVAASVESIVTRDLRAELIAHILVPDDLKDAQHQSGWRQAIWEAAEKKNGPRSFAEVWPDADRELREAARQARQRLPQAQAALKKCQQQLAALQQERDLERAGAYAEELAELLRRRRLLYFGRLGLIGLEVASAIATVALAEGCLDYDRLRDVPHTLWLRSAFIGSTLSTAIFVVTYLLGRTLERRGIHLLGSRAVLAGGLACGLALLLGLTGYRLVGLLPASQLTPALELAHAATVAVAGGAIVLVVAAAGAEALRQQVKATDDAIRNTREVVTFFARREAELRKELTAATATVAALRAALRRPARLAIAFERELSHGRELQRYGRVRLQEVVQEARLAWEEVQGLSEVHRRFLRGHLRELLPDQEVRLTSAAVTLTASGGAAPVLDLEDLDDDTDASSDEPPHTAHRRSR